MKRSDTTKKLLIALEAPSKGGDSGGQHDFNAQHGARIETICALLKKAGIEYDAQIVKIIFDNFAAKNRLINLFKLLKKCNIPLTESLNDLIANNVSKANSMASLLTFLYEININFDLVNLKMLFTCSFSVENLISGLRQINAKGYLDAAAIKLMFKYLESSLELAIFIVNLESRFFSVESIESKLHQFSEVNISSILVLLTFVLDKNLYYSDLIDILFKHQEHIDAIYEGAKKLALENVFSALYFEVIETNPENANIFAKNIILLSKASLIDYQDKQDLLVVSQLSLGAFYFLGYLNNAGLLNQETYHLICANNAVFSKKEVIDVFRKIPLFDTFHKEELNQLIHLINKPELSESDYTSFVEIISKHQIIKPYTDRLLVF